jgi:hypothetical protein
MEKSSGKPIVFGADLKDRFDGWLIASLLKGKPWLSKKKKTLPP